MAVGFAWGVGLGLVQLLPGWSFINFSERSEVNYGFYGAGSLAVRWTTLLFTPDLFGGNGAFGQSAFFANYNLAEVTGYVGILALIAGAAFLTRLTRRGWRGADRDWVIYAVIGVIGLFATWGSFTPLGHLFRDIPLYGSTRLQSRNVILVDFPLVDVPWTVAPARSRRAGRTRAGLSRRWRAGSRSCPRSSPLSCWSGSSAGAPWVIDKIGITHEVYATLEGGLRLANSLFLAIALLSVVAIVLLARHARKLFNVLMVILVCDIALFVIFTSSGLIGGQGPREASPRRRRAPALERRAIRAGRPGGRAHRDLPHDRRTEHERLYPHGERAGLRGARL